MNRTIMPLLAAAALFASPLTAQQRPSRAPRAPRAPSPPCAADNAGLTLPAGFCAAIVADSVGRARHLVVAPNGDVLVALRGDSGGVLLLRDTSADGSADVRQRFGPGGGSGIALYSGFLYFATDDAVLRWAWQPGQLEPAAPPDTIVKDLLNRRQHASKGIAVATHGLYVNIGAPANACQEPDREVGVPGQDPCPLLDVGGGVWRFAPARAGQTQTRGARYATGLRNALALAVEPRTGAVYAAQHGRDDLHRLWPTLYTEQQNAEKPAEELFRLEPGGNYGWPYCFYDPEAQAKVLNPEYVTDSSSAARCAGMKGPVVAFPAHWAPNAIAFYTGAQFPAQYRGGLFLAFHGSWNRAPLPQAGYNVTFAPFDSTGKAVGTWEVFASGFAGADSVAQPGDAAHRPSGVAVGPDGSLYVSDDRGGRIYRISFTGVPPAAQPAAPAPAPAQPPPTPPPPTPPPAS